MEEKKGDRLKRRGREQTRIRMKTGGLEKAAGDKERTESTARKRPEMSGN